MSLLKYYRKGTRQNMSILSIRNVNYTYQGASSPALSDINIEFEPGTVYAIKGKSGSGKTTLLSLLAGLDNVTSGEILFKGKNLNTIDKDEYRAKDIGVIFQGFNLLTNYTALQNVLLSMNVSEMVVENKKEYAYNMLQKVGIDRESANRKVLNLSGGEQQRVAIARTIATKSDIIIADEPTGNLDDETEESIMEILKGLAHEDGKCVIIVTHSNKVAKQSDELLGISNKKLIYVK